MVEEAQLAVKIKFLPEIDALKTQIDNTSKAKELQPVRKALMEQLKAKRKEAEETYDAEVKKVKASKKFKDLKAEIDKLGKETTHIPGNMYPVF